MTSPTHGAPTPEKKALIEAFDQVLKADAEKRDQDAAPPKRVRKWPLHPIAVLSLLLLAGVGAYLTVTRPVWLFERGLPAESSEIQDASLRLAMALQFQRIERFRSEHGRLPRSLAEAGEPLAGVTYRQTGGGQFVLSGVNGSVSLVLRSTESVRAFVANSYVTIQRRGQR